MRPKAFDQTQALDAAMMQFWESGYEGSSMQDLVERMRISRQSLYDTYGNKRELFEAALSRYRDEVIEPAIRSLMDPSRTPAQAVRHHLESIAAGRQDRPPGCLVVRSATELPVEDDTVGAMLEACVRDIRDALEARIEEGRGTGDFDPDRSSTDLAGSVLAASIGLHVMNRFPDRGAGVRPCVDALMAGLAPCPGH
jgi:TetR/AcrR family transcriptional repressor of nem operon